MSVILKCIKIGKIMSEKVIKTNAAFIALHCTICLKPKYGLFVFSFKDSFAPILSKFVVEWRGPVCH